MDNHTNEREANITTDSTNSQLPIEYRRSGTSGHARSTVSGKTSAMKHFNDFLFTKRMGNFDTLNENEACSIILFQEYGTYLAEFAKRRNQVSRNVCNTFPQSDLKIIHKIPYAFTGR